MKKVFNMAKYHNIAFLGTQILKICCGNTVRSGPNLTQISHLTYPKQSVEQDQQNFEKPQSGDGRQRFTHFDDSSSKSLPLLGSLLVQVMKESDWSRHWKGVMVARVLKAVLVLLPIRNSLPAFQSLIQKWWWIPTLRCQNWILYASLSFIKLDWKRQKPLQWWEMCNFNHVI